MTNQFRQGGFFLGALLAGSAVNGQDVLKPLVVTGEREVREIREVRNDDDSAIVKHEDFGAERVGELMGVVPGFSVIASDSGGYGDTIAVRGTTNTLFFGPPGVGLTVDGIPYGDVYGYSTEFFELESLKLHRGFQGYRFAANGAGGMIEATTARPGETQKFGFDAEYGSDDLFGLRFLASGPISDKWSYAFQAYYKERNGFLENVNPAASGFPDTREQFGALGTLYYNPSADFEIKVRAMYERVRDGSQRLSALPGVASSFGPFIDGARAQDPYKVSSNFNGITEIDRFQISLHSERDFGWATFKSASSYQKWELDPSTFDLDLSPIPASTSTINQEQELFTSDYRLVSPEGERMRWQLGLSHLGKKSEGVANRFFGTGETTFENQFTDFRIEDESYALFGSVDFDLNDALTVEVGGRLEYLESDIKRRKTGAGNPFPSAFPLPGTLRGESDGWYFSPTLGIRYALNSETTLFARTSSSFKPQGFTAFSDDPRTTAYDEEQAWETEIGVNYQSSDKSLGFEVRGYYKQIDDYQLNRTSGLTDFIIVNADRVEAIGLEGELNWRPTDDLTISATAGWSQIEFDDHTGPMGTDFEGNEVPFLPQFTAALGARYDFCNGFFVQSALRTVGKTNFDEANTDDFSQSSYKVWDAQIGYETDTWNAALFVRNIMEEEYYTFVNPQIAAGTPGDPQVVGVRFGMDF